jgi:hypothetical protein
MTNRSQYRHLINGTFTHHNGSYQEQNRLRAGTLSGPEVPALPEGEPKIRKKAKSINNDELRELPLH